MGLILSSCGKEEEKNVIPAYPVHFKVNISGFDAALKTPGNIKIFETPRLDNEYVGYSGLIIVCDPRSEMNNPNLFAYDLCCPYEAQKNVKVTPSSDDGTASCSKCGSVFDLYSGLGNVKSGPSDNPLQVYWAKASTNGVFYVQRKN